MSEKELGLGTKDLRNKALLIVKQIVYLIFYFCCQFSTKKQTVGIVTIVVEKTDINLRQANPSKNGIIT